MDQSWLTGEQFARIAPHLPAATRGKERVDDQRVTTSEPERAVGLMAR